MKFSLLLAAALACVTSAWVPVTPKPFTRTVMSAEASEASTRAEFLKQGMAAAAAVAAAAAPAMAAVEEVETPVNYGKNPGAIANRRAGTAGAKTEIKKFNNNKTGNAGSIYKK
eukprot:CAMPEP_0119541578 /NCGR_PEP_ID=MMETSP1344-20130328/53042_1 /TAXON_ID=236787 /ORGANISM="Florenciella parvula, Strain CCMP2471" /LENGTH=113 /DNA_ID=CAMNT_0007585585 /DNA_START=39 /DNA_END=380 /DNA_ORIENTATION=+